MIKNQYNGESYDQRMEKLQTGRDKHGFKKVQTQDGRIMYWDSVTDRVKLFCN